MLTIKVLLIKSAVNGLNFYLCRVRKVGGHLAVFLLLFCNMSLYQLVKLPILVQHYQEHRQRDQSVDLLDFLSMHYWGKDINDNDQEKDNQLPFKAFNKETLEHFSTPVKTFALKSVIYFFKSTFLLTGETYLPDPKLAALFRPPRA